MSPGLLPQQQNAVTNRVKCHMFFILVCHTELWLYHPTSHEKTDEKAIKCNQVVGHPLLPTFYSMTKSGIHFIILFLPRACIMNGF